MTEALETTPAPAVSPGPGKSPGLRLSAPLVVGLVLGGLAAGIFIGTRIMQPEKVEVVRNVPVPCKSCEEEAQKKALEDARTKAETDTDEPPGD